MTTSAEQGDQGSASDATFDAVFEDVLSANRAYAQGFRLGGLKAPAAKHLALVTCMDSRIEPLAMVGIEAGDAKILRNAGAQVSEAVHRDLVLAHHLLAVDRIMVVAHTSCAMSSATDEEVASVLRSHGVEPDDLDFGLVPDQRDALRTGVERLRTSPWLAGRVTVGGFIYDVRSGLLSREF